MATKYPGGTMIVDPNPFGLLASAVVVGQVCSLLQLPRILLTKSTQLLFQIAWQLAELDRHEFQLTSMQSNAQVSCEKWV
jgi:hypothetical protein